MKSNKIETLLNEVHSKILVPKQTRLSTPANGIAPQVTIYNFSIFKNSGSKFCYIVSFFKTDHSHNISSWRSNPQTCRRYIEIGMPSRRNSSTIYRLVQSESGSLHLHFKKPSQLLLSQWALDFKKQCLLKSTIKLFSA